MLVSEVCRFARFERHVWGALSQPDRRHLSCLVAKLILVTYKSVVHPLSPRLPVNVGHYEDTFCKVGDDWAAGPAGHLPSVRERDRPVAAADW